MNKKMLISSFICYLTLTTSTYSQYTNFFTIDPLLNLNSNSEADLNNYQDFFDINHQDSCDERYQEFLDTNSHYADSSPFNRETVLDSISNINSNSEVNSDIYPSSNLNCLNLNKNTTFACKYCDLALPTQHKRKKHENIHEGLDFKCTYEGCTTTSYSTKENLKLHIKIKHLDTTTYECKYCKKTLTTKYKLKNHENIHNNIPKKNISIKCTYDKCTKSYANKDSLNWHIKHKHSLNAPKFTCPFPGCNKEYSYNTVLKDHLKKDHPITFEPDK